MGQGAVLSASSPCACFKWASNCCCSDLAYSSRPGRWLPAIGLNLTPAHAVHSASTGIVPSHLVPRRVGFFARIFLRTIGCRPTPHLQVCGAHFSSWFLGSLFR